MYIDPPYPGNKVNYKHNMRNWDDHKRLADRLAKVDCKWIVSSYDVPEVRNLYAEYIIIPVTAYSGMRVRKSETKRVLNQEVLIINYPLSIGSNSLDAAMTQGNFLK